MTERAGIHITDGTAQQDRLPVALGTGYFRVDELSFEDLLAMSARFASVLNYFDLSNRRSGTWADLFSTNGIAIMATVLSTDTKKLESSFLQEYTVRPVKAVSQVYDLARKFDEWFKGLVRSDAPEALLLANKIAGLIDEKLADELHSLGDVIDRLRSSDENVLLYDFCDFDSLWGIRSGDKTVSFPRSKVGQSQDIVHLRRVLRTIQYNFLHGVSYLQSITGMYMKDGLVSQGNTPAVGLFISFLKLYEHVQKRLNRFTDRHLDFYYNDVLRIRPRKAEPDHVYLLLEPDAGVGECFIPRGTVFRSGQYDKGEEIVYEADHDLLLTHGKVESLLTLSLQKNMLISPERELHYVSTIKSDTVPSLAVGSLELPDRPYPVFGTAKGADEQATARDAEIGFAIASPLLFLDEGVRRIDVTVELTPKVVLSLSEQLACLVEVGTEQDFYVFFGRIFACYLFSDQEAFAADELWQIKNKAKIVLDDVSFATVCDLLDEDRGLLFTKLLKKAFNVSLSTQGGWYHNDEYVVLPLATLATKGLGVEYGFTLTLELEPEVEPIVACNSEVHGGDWESGLPILRFILNPQSNFYPYSILEGFKLNKITIESSVKGAKNIVAYNNHGRLDPSKPFHPFGPLPARESYLIVGHHEAVRKRLVSLRLRFFWNELPDNYGGFKEYYSGYGDAYHNDAFMLKQQVLQDCEWQPGKESISGHTCLFETGQPGDMIKEETTVDLGILGHFKPIPMTTSVSDYEYGLKTRRGFFRLMLNCPPEAFGHQRYPALLTKILSHNSAIKKKYIALPNQPYTPLLGGMSLDYVARCVIDVQENDVASLADSPDRIFHIHPFGARCVSKSGLDSFSLLPEYKYAGNLFIGLSGVPGGGVISLFFHLIEDVSPDVFREKVYIEWFFLGKDGWHLLEPSHVILDSTSGFLTSGVVKLHIPDSIVNSNSLMPKDYYWLKGCSNNDLQSYCSIYTVQTNGMMLRRRAAKEESVHFSRVMQKGKEWKPVTPIAGLSGIIQPVNSFGGRPRENREQLKMRTSERLRHKNRASSSWDYERLILDRFPGLLKVKCFPHLKSDAIAVESPGHVCIVVVPSPQGAAQEPWCTAMVNGFELRRIRDFVQSLTSDFIQVEVRNPTYEQVQIRCTVKLKSTRASGRCITRLNQDISNYMSPWRPGGYTARFGWSIRQKDIEAHIRSLEYVEFVTNFSMLHIFGRNEERYGLFDSASSTVSGRAVVSPQYPWSLAIPMRHHYIETMDNVKPISAEITGIGELEIGGTLILDGGHNGA